MWGAGLAGTEALKVPPQLLSQNLQLKKKKNPLGIPMHMNFEDYHPSWPQAKPLSTQVSASPLVNEDSNAFSSGDIKHLTTAGGQQTMTIII